MIAAYIVAALMLQDTTVLEGATVIGATGALRDQTIIVADGRIVSISPTRARASSSATRRVVDVRGKFIVPGLIDAHTHLPLQAVPRRDAADALTLFVANGVTSVRGMFSDSSHLQLRRQVDRGELVGPSMLIAAPAVQGALQVPADQAVQAWRALGYDQAKVIGGNKETFEQVVHAARAAKMPVAGHVPPGVGLEGALAAGMQFYEHLDGFMEFLVPPASRQNGGFFGLNIVEAADTSRMRDLVRVLKEADAVVVPTAQAMKTYADTISAASYAAARGEIRYMPPQARGGWTNQINGFKAQFGGNPSRAEKFVQYRRAMINALQKGGVRVVAGSDAVTAFAVPGFALHHELAELVAAGLTPVEAIGAATWVSARALNLGDRGEVAAGKRADLLIVDADPRVAIENLRAIAGVVVNGRFHDRADIERMLAQIAAR